MSIINLCIIGKGLNIFDNVFHQIPSPAVDGTNGDIACDSYHKYAEDVSLLKYIGVKVLNMYVKDSMPGFLRVKFPVPGILSWIGIVPVPGNQKTIRM